MIARLLARPWPRRRLTRTRFWVATMIQSAAVMGLIAADLLVFGDGGAAPEGLAAFALKTALGLATTAAAAFGIVLAIRRLRDAGRSGWWVLLGTIPLIGGLLLLVQAGRRDRAQSIAPKSAHRISDNPMRHR